jgi:hypothetical protein
MADVKPFGGRLHAYLLLAVWKRAQIDAHAGRQTQSI